MFEQTFKNIDDKLWIDAGCSSELDYVEQTLAMSLRGRSCSLPEAIPTQTAPPVLQTPSPNPTVFPSDLGREGQ